MRTNKAIELMLTDPAVAADCREIQEKLRSLGNPDREAHHEVTLTDQVENVKMTYAVEKRH